MLLALLFTSQVVGYAITLLLGLIAGKVATVVVRGWVALRTLRDRVVEAEREAGDLRAKLDKAKEMGSLAEEALAEEKRGAALVNESFRLSLGLARGKLEEAESALLEIRAREAERVVGRVECDGCRETLVTGVFMGPPTGPRREFKAWCDACDERERRRVRITPDMVRVTPAVRCGACGAAWQGSHNCTGT